VPYDKYKREAEYKEEGVCPADTEMFSDVCITGSRNGKVFSMCLWKQYYYSNIYCDPFAMNADALF